MSERLAIADTLASRLDRVRDDLARTRDPLDHPLGVRFTPLPGARALDAWRRLAASRAHRDLVLYVHVPFCARVCSYCLLSARRSPSRAGLAAYVRALRQEIALVAPAVRDLEVSTVHVGGGTPTLLTPDELDAVLGDVLSNFRRAPGFQIGVEAHPGTSSRARMDALARHGVDRVSLGVETFTPAVLQNVNRADQSAEDVRDAVAHARAAGIGAVNLDLLAGLPGETVESFSASVRAALALAPDAMSVNRYLAEQSPLAAFGYAPSAADNALADAMLLAADAIIHDERPPARPTRRLDAPAYGAQYVWDATGRARSYFQQDMIGPASVLALGHGGMGHVHGGAFTTAAGRPADYVAALDGGRLPDVIAWSPPPRFEPAFYVMDRACRGALSAREFARVFRTPMERVFGEELAFLAARGLLTRAGDRWEKPAARGFHALHLLAFLLGDAPARGALPDAAHVGDAAALTVTGAPDDAQRLLDLAAAKPRAVRLTVAHDTDATHARDLLRAASAKRVPVELVPRDDAGQYADIAAELPPSLVWCRLAMRAVESARRLAGGATDRV